MMRQRLSPRSKSSTGRWALPLRNGALWLALLVSLTVLTFALAALGVFDATALVGKEFAQHYVPRFQQDLTTGSAFVVALLACLGAVIALAGLLRGTGRPSRQHVLVADEQGFVLVEMTGVESVACAAALRAAGVVEAEAVARGIGGNPVRLSVEVGVHPGASIERAGRDARRLARRAVEELVGLQVSDVVVTVHVLDADALGRALS